MHEPVVRHSFQTRLKGLITLLRPRQWVKNGFVFAPLLFLGEFLNRPAVGQAALAAVLFCVASSATYIVNDIRDIDNDRQHPKKSRSRPLAAGNVTIAQALVLLAVLYCVLIWGWFVAPAVIKVILGYLALQLAYTLVLKNQPLLDIFSIAIGFVLRVEAGAVALSVQLSSWMFVTTLCLALYLAAVKRRQELAQNGASGRKVLKHYSVELLDRYAEMSATGALVFYSMFVLSTHPDLVVTIPLVLFGLFRYWYVVESLEGGESPSDALLSDWQLLVTVVAWVAVCGWAMVPALH